MTSHVRFRAAAFLLVFLWFANGHASEQTLPIIDGKETIALVNDEPITLKEFNEILAYMHGESDEKRNVDKIDYSEPLRRLINGKLILFEARNIGIDELPEIIKNMEVYSKETMIKLLLLQHVKNIQPDENKIEELYKEKIREYKIKSAYFSKEEDAFEMEQAIRRGDNFDDVIKKLIEEGKVVAGGEAGYVKSESLLPQVIEVISKMKIGEGSHVVKVEKGFALIKLEDIRFPESAEAREKARQEVMTQKRKETLEAYATELKDKYVKIDEKLLNALDYEAKEPGFENFLKDERIVAAIKGSSPISVADLTKKIQDKFYHGIESAIKSKMINNVKTDVLGNIVKERIFLVEATLLNIDKSIEYVESMNKHENNIVFNAFVQKTIDPEIKIEEAEVRTYFQEHSEEYTIPEMIRIRNLIFGKRENAEDAIEKLRSGADFKWVKENADHQIDEKSEDKLLLFSGNLIMTSGLPKEVQTSVQRARSGDYRFFEDAEGRFHVLYIQEVIPPKPETFENAKGSLIKKIMKEKRKKSLDDWAERLRTASDIKIFATDIEMGHGEKR